MIQTITELGITALARALTESFDIEFTRCVVGEGEFDPATQDAEAMTALLEPVAEIEITAVRAESFGCSVVVDLKNTIGGGGSGLEIPGGTPLSELGVFARVGTESDFLFAYGYDTEPDSIPEGEGTYERRFVSRFAMSQEELELTVTYNAFMDSFEEAIKPYKEQIDGKADKSHGHDASDISSGTLPVLRGGTGAASASTARANLGAASTDDVNALVSASA